MCDNIVAIALGALGDIIGGTVIINVDDMDLLFRFINCLTVSLCGVFSIEQIYELLCNYIDIKKIDKFIKDDQILEGKGYKMPKVNIKRK